MKKLVIILGFVLLSALIVVVITYGYYYYSMKSSNQEYFEKWFKNDFLIDSYTGTVSEINYYNRDFCVITISVPNQNDRIYNMCEGKIEIKEGDTLVKYSNNYDLYKLGDGMKIVLKYNFCKN
jgi:hypothetical protein